MVTTITGKVGKVRKMLNLLMCPDKDAGKAGAMFPSVVLKLTVGAPGTIECIAMTEKKSVIARSAFYDFHIAGEDAEVAIDCVKFNKYLSTLAAPEEDVQLEFDQDFTRIILPQDIASIPSMDPEHVTTAVAEYPFVVDEHNVPMFKKGKSKLTTKVELDVGIIQQTLRKGSLVGAEAYPLTFDKDGIKTVLGNKTNRSEAHIESSSKDISVTGPDFNVTLGDGFNGVFTTLEGVVFILGRTDHPIYVAKQIPEYELSFVITPKVKDA